MNTNSPLRLAHTSTYFISFQRKHGSFANRYVEINTHIHEKLTMNLIKRLEKEIEDKENQQCSIVFFTKIDNSDSEEAVG